MLVIVLIALTGCSNGSEKVVEDYQMTLEKVIDMANNETLNSSDLDLKLYSDLENITPSKLGNIIAKELSFVNDNHLRINDSVVMPENKTKYNREYSSFKCEKIR